jgi:hypothetical protein
MRGIFSDGVGNKSGIISTQFLFLVRSMEKERVDIDFVFAHYGSKLPMMPAFVNFVKIFHDDDFDAYLHNEVISKLFLDALFNHTEFEKYVDEAIVATERYIKTETAVIEHSKLVNNQMMTRELMLKSFKDNNLWDFNKTECN